MIIYNDNWHVASIFDELGNVVQLNTLVGGETGFEMEPIAQEHTAGDYQSGERNAMMIASTDYEGVQQLRDWRKDYTPVAAVALSRSGNGRCYRWTSYRKLKEFIDNAKSVRSEGDSFLKAILEDFDVNPARARNLLNGVAGTDIIFPIAGETLTLAGEGGAAFNLTLTAYDFDEVQLDTVTAAFNNERGSVELLLPAETWRVEWDVDVAVDASLRADGSTEYVEG